MLKKHYVAILFFFQNNKSKLCISLNCLSLIHHLPQEISSEFVEISFTYLYLKLCFTNTPLFAEKQFYYVEMKVLVIRYPQILAVRKGDDEKSSVTGRNTYDNTMTVDIANISKGNDGVDKHCQTDIAGVCIITRVNFTLRYN